MQILIKSLIFRTLQIYIFSFYAFLFFVSLADTESFIHSVEKVLSSPFAIGIVCQKKNRKALSGKYLSFEKRNKAIHQFWKKYE